MKQVLTFFVIFVRYLKPEEVIIAYGDTDGFVNVLVFNAIGETLR